MKIKRPNEVISDINVTPFIDIMLVLLIIFMIVAKISQTSFNIELPTASQSPSEIQDELRISYNEKGELFFNKSLTSFEDLELILESANNKLPVLIELDKGTSYEILIKIMDILKSKNFLNLNLLSFSNE